MNTAIKNAKKTLAVLLCVLMFSSFALPFAGAEGAMNWNFSEDGYSLTVPKTEAEFATLTLPEATLDGAEGAVEYELLLADEETAAPAIFVFSKDKPEIKIKNDAKKYVFANDTDKDGAITLLMRAVCGDVKSDFCKIKVENFKVKAVFNYMNKDGEDIQKETEVYYGNSVKDFAATEVEPNLFEKPSDAYYHYKFIGWVDLFGEGEESTVERLTRDTTFDSQISSGTHDFEVVETKPATCTVPGLDVKVCKDKECGYKVETPIPASHKMVVDKPAQPATCTEDGWTEEAHCENCDYKVESTVIESTGHTPVVDPATEPTCTEPGKTEGSHCGVCGDVLVAQKVDETKPALDHDKVNHDAKAATCTEKGWEAYVTCSRCDYTTYKEIAPLGHEFDVGNDSAKIEAVEPTCLTEGHTAGYKCKREGCDQNNCEVISKLDHTNERIDIKPAVAATCKETGLTEGYTCPICKTVVEQQVTEKLPHTPEVLPAVAATCTETGLTEGTRCSVCKEIITAQEVTKALGHDMVVTAEGYAATCTEKGLTDERKCTRCDVVEKQTEIPAEGHNLVTEYGRDATCTEDGLTDRIFCTKCDYVEKEAEKISSFGGHQDLDNDGFCDRCGAAVEKPAPDHQCGCMCHKPGFVGWLWKSILLPICKFLGIEQECACGILHWTK